MGIASRSSSTAPIRPRVQHPLSFGREQDVGFQKPIDVSREAPPIRFSASSPGARPRRTRRNLADRRSSAARRQVLWVRARTRDTGLRSRRLTFQFTHATADDTNASADFILDEFEGVRRHRRDDLASGGRSARRSARSIITSPTARSPSRGSRDAAASVSGRGGTVFIKVRAEVL